MPHKIETISAGASTMRDLFFDQPQARQFAGIEPFTKGFLFWNRTLHDLAVSSVRPLPSAAFRSQYVLALKQVAHRRNGALCIDRAEQVERAVALARSRCRG